MILLNSMEQSTILYHLEIINIFSTIFKKKWKVFYLLKIIYEFFNNFLNATYKFFCTIQRLFSTPSTNLSFILFNFLLSQLKLRITASGNQFSSHFLACWIFMCKENPRHCLFAGPFRMHLRDALSPFFTASATAENTQFKCRREERKFFVLSSHGKNKNEQQIHCGLLFVVPGMAIIQ